MDSSQVTSADRERTKHVVYAVVYGVGESAFRYMYMQTSSLFSSHTGKDRLGEILNEPSAVAKRLTSSFLGEMEMNLCNIYSNNYRICRFTAKFPGVKKYINETIAQCRAKGEENVIY